MVNHELQELMAELDAGIKRIKIMGENLEDDDLGKLGNQLQRVIEFTAEVAKLIDDCEIVQREVDAKQAIQHKQAGQRGTQSRLVFYPVRQVDHIRWSTGAEQCADQPAAQAGRHRPVPRHPLVTVNIEQIAQGKQNDKQCECSEQWRPG